MDVFKVTVLISNYEIIINVRKKTISNIYSSISFISSSQEDNIKTLILYYCALLAVNSALENL